jgi:hypothetical protein
MCLADKKKPPSEVTLANGERLYLRCLCRNKILSMTEEATQNIYVLHEIKNSGKFRIGTLLTPSYKIQSDGSLTETAVIPCFTNSSIWLR